MLMNLCSSKIRLYIKNPIAIFSIISIVITLFLLITVHFHLPDFYTDRTAAFNAAQLPNREEAMRIMQGLENPKYGIFNFIANLFAISISLLIISLVFKLKSFKEILENKIFNNKKFLYIWLNLSFLAYIALWAICYVIDLEKYEYPTHADSMGIPFFGSLLSMVCNAFLYYPVMNTLLFVTLNTKISNRFYSFCYWIVLFYYLWMIVTILTFHYSWISILMYVYLFITIISLVILLKIHNSKINLKL